jgi:hypothetical protein
VEAASRLGDAGDLHVLAIQAYADPFGHAPAVLARVQQAAAEGSHDTEALLYLGPAAVAVGAFHIGMTLLSAATEGLRADGRLAHLAYMLAIQGIVATRLADWDVAIPAAEEARSLLCQPARRHSNDDPAGDRRRATVWLGSSGCGPLPPRNAARPAAR